MKDPAPVLRLIIVGLIAFASLFLILAEGTPDAAAPDHSFKADSNTVIVSPGHPTTGWSDTPPVGYERLAPIGK